MPIVVNTNSAATSASFNLSKANDAFAEALRAYRRVTGLPIPQKMQAACGGLQARFSC